MTDTIVVTAAQPEPEPVAMPAVDETKGAGQAEQGAELQADAPASEPKTDGDDKPEGDKPEGEKKPRGWVSTRINELTREKHEARREAEEAKAERERLKAELEVLRRGQVQQPPNPAAPAPEGFDPFDPASVAAFVQKQAAEQARAVIAAERAAIEREASARTFADKRNEFQAKLGETNEGAVRLLTDNDAPVTADMAEFILDSPDGVSIADHLGSNYAEAARIASLPPVQRGIELARLEARLRPAQQPSSPAVRPSNAPAPPPIVGARAVASANPETMTQAQYEAWRQSQKRG